jgi:FMN phosphatase YigB (HAD superfamily)
MQQILRANALDAAWFAAQDDVKVLSLDCFDTLLWRKVAAPTDVFFALASREPYRRHGLSAALRVRAESAARRARQVLNRGAEVTLEEIYRQALPAASEAEIAELAALEVEVEIDYCFVFKPVYDLVVQAKQRGARVVVVSDTYLGEAQLKRLLFGCMPGLEGLLDAVYCSSVYGMSKGAGIWTRLLPLLRVRPDQVLHLGDNPDADLRSPMRFGMRSAQLVHHDEDTDRILEGRSQAAVQLLPEVRHSAPLPCYSHALIAAGRATEPLERFGYNAMGPVMHAFAGFVLREIARLAQGGATVRTAFLMRDGYLIGKACAELAGAPVGSALNVSRFTAIAASLAGRDQVAALLGKMLGPDSIEPLARQLLLPAALAARIVRQSMAAPNPEKTFAELVLARDTLKAIGAESNAFRKRLLAHVRKMTGVQPGDTLVFVDLGYSGTAQNLLKDVFEQDLGVTLHGLYLLADRVQAGQHDRKGLLDSAQVDPRIIGALTGNNIASFEMLSTQGGPSTVGYTEQGDPVFWGSNLDSAQHASVEEIQAACLRYIADARALPECHQPSWNEAEVAHSVAIDLARMMYFPTMQELEATARFQFDFNLGTDKTMALFDPAAGLAGMRRQGFGYMNAKLDDMRTNYAMELRMLDLSLSVMLFAQNRYGFAMYPANASYRGETVQVVFHSADEHAVEQVRASLTYDGYFALCVPVSSRFDAAVNLGQCYSWVQIDSVQLVANLDMDNGSDMQPGDQVVFDGMEHMENGLFRVGPGGLVFLPGRQEYGKAAICRIVFRPIALVPPAAH